MGQLEKRYQASGQVARRGTAAALARLTGSVERNIEVLAQDVRVRLSIAERWAEAEIRQNRMDRQRWAWMK
jgi:hypothetical protein